MKLTRLLAAALVIGVAHGTSAKAALYQIASPEDADLVLQVVYILNPILTRTSPSHFSSTFHLAEIGKAREFPHSQTNRAKVSTGHGISSGDSSNRVIESYCRVAATLTIDGDFCDLAVNATLERGGTNDNCSQTYRLQLKENINQSCDFLTIRTRWWEPVQ